MDDNIGVRLSTHHNYPQLLRTPTNYVVMKNYNWDMSEL